MMQIGTNMFQKLALDGRNAATVLLVSLLPQKVSMPWQCETTRLKVIEEAGNKSDRGPHGGNLSNALSPSRLTAGQRIRTSRTRPVAVEPLSVTMTLNLFAIPVPLPSGMILGEVKT